MQPPISRPDWPSDREWVLAALARIEAKVDPLKDEVAGLRVKAGIWGLLAGAIPTTLAAAWHLFTSRPR